MTIGKTEVTSNEGHCSVTSPRLACHVNGKVVYWTLICVTIGRTEVTAAIGRTEAACGINAIVSYGTLTYLTLAQLATTQTAIQTSPSGNVTLVTLLNLIFKSQLVF
jgi:hypothetical protein